MKDIFVTEIKIEAYAGSSVYDVIKEMLELKELYGVNLSCDFNGVTITTCGNKENIARYYFEELRKETTDEKSPE